MATLTKDYQLIGVGSVQYFNGAGARLNLYAKYNDQDIVNNNTNYTVQARLEITTYSGDYIGDYTGTELKIISDDINYTENTGTGNFRTQILGWKSGTTTHNNNGEKTINASASMEFKAWGKTLTVSGSADLPKIPRYATITSFTVSKRDETSVTYNWNVDATCDYAKYSIDNGSTWNDLSINNIVSGLSPNTTYNFKLQLRRQDSQLWTESSTVQQTTYDYPYCTNTPNFKIGELLTLNFYNPLGRTFKFYVIANGTQINDEWTIGGTSYTGINAPATQQKLYATIPNQKSAAYQIKVVYGSSTKTRNNGNTFSVDERYCLPIFTNFEYEDDDTTVSNLTGDNQLLVNNNSDCLFKISSQNKAVGNYSATITKYILNWGNVSNEITDLTPENLSGYCYDGSGDILKVSAVDSRGLSTTVSKTITNIPYISAIINNVSTQRKDGVDSKTYLAGKFTIYNGSWDATGSANSMNRLKYVGYSVYVNNAWSQYYDITNDILNVATITNVDNTKIYEFNFSDEIEIHANGSSGGFSLGTEYPIRVLIKDGNNNYVFTPYSYQALYQTTVNDGTVATCLHKDNTGKYHLGINCMSDDSCMVMANDKPIVDNDGHLINKDFYSGLIQSAHWFYLGDFKFDTQGQYAIINCYTGSGQNGGASQNTHIEILLKRGWTGENLPIGITAKFIENYKGDYLIKIRHKSKQECSLYIYLPFAYNDLTYSISGSYVEFIKEEEILDSEPITDKEATYIVGESNYSSKEKVIGIDKDGYLIYQKTIYVGTPTSQRQVIPHGIANPKKLYKRYGRCIRNDSGFGQCIPENYINWELYLYDFDNYNIVFRASDNQWNGGISDLEITLEYTKN